MTCIFTAGIPSHSRGELPQKLVRYFNSSYTFGSAVIRLDNILFLGLGLVPREPGKS